MHVEVKICGVTRPEDAELAASNGAWRIGVVFAGGPRRVTVSKAVEIVAAAGMVPVVGVFGTSPVASILQTRAAVGLRGVQLHGTFSGEDVATLRAAGLEVWRVAAIAPGAEIERVVAAATIGADVVLVEPAHPDGMGGKGVPLDPALARRAREAAAATRVALAGGLRADTVAEAIRLVGPDAVDVSSGVEKAPGIKDREQLIRFLEQARDARPAS